MPPSLCPRCRQPQTTPNLSAEDCPGCRSVIDSILARWEAGGSTLDDLVSDHPELRGEVERRIEALKSMAAWLTQGHTPSAGGEDEGPPPAIPGFEIQGVLGRGGMGVVYRALQVGLNRDVALKMIFPEGGLNPEYRARFRQEAEAVAKLHHPQIVQIHEIGEHDGRPFLVLEYLDGGSLHGRLRKCPLPPADAALLVEQLALGVQHAHERGVVHRDLKPHNVLLGAGGVARITDFGLAKLADRDTGLSQTGQMMGTPCYMSPEQASGNVKEVGPAADVYGLGAILYECLTGRPPFQGPDVLDVLLQVRMNDPVPPRRLQPRVPRDLETVCLKCLEKDPARRYASAAELADDLRRFREGQTVRARPAGRLERAWRWVRRNPVSAGLLTASGACAVLLVAGLWFREQARAASRLADANRELAEKTEDLARTEGYHKTLYQVREQAANPHPGWTWANQRLLHDVAHHRRRDEAALRTLALEAATALDLRKVAEFDETPPACVAFSDDGKRVAISDRGNPAYCAIFVYDVATRRKVATYSFSNVATAARISLLHLASGQFAGAPSDRPEAIAFSPDGRWLVAGTRRGQVIAWDTTKTQEGPTVTQEVYQVKNAKEGAGKVDQVFKVFFSPDSRELYACLPRVPMTRCWDVANGWQEKKEMPGRTARFASISPDGEWMSYHEDVHRVLYRPTGEVWEIGGHHAWSNSLIMPGNQLIFVIDTNDHALNRLDRVAAQEVKVQWVRDRLGGIGYTMACPRDVNFVLTGDGSAVRFWDVGLERVILALPMTSPTHYERVALSSDGSLLAVASETKTTLYEVRRTPVQRVVALGTSQVNTIDVSPDGRGLAVNRGHTADIWDTTDGRLVRTVKVQIMHTHPTFGLPGGAGHGGFDIAWHPDNDRIAWNSTWIGLTQISRSKGLLGTYSNRGIDMPDKPDSRFRETILAPTAPFTSPTAEKQEVVADPLAPDGRAIRLGPGRKTAVKFSELEARGLKEGPYLVGFFARVERKGRYQDVEVLESALVGEGGRTHGGRTSLWHIPDGAYHFYAVGNWNADELRRRAGESLTIGNIAPADRVEAVWVSGLAAIPIGRDNVSHGFGRLRHDPEGRELWGMSEYQHILWDAPSRAIRRVWDNRPLTFLTGINARLTALDVQAGRMVATNYVGNLILDRPGADQPEYVKGLKDTPNALAILGDGSAAVGNGEGQLRVVRLPDGELITEVTGHQLGITSLAYCEPLQLLVSGSRDRSVVLWRWRNNTLQELVRIKNLPRMVRSVRLDAVGRGLYVLLEDDHAVRMWDLQLMREVLRDYNLDPWDEAGPTVTSAAP